MQEWAASSAVIVETVRASWLTMSLDSRRCFWCGRWTRRFAVMLIALACQIHCAGSDAARDFLGRDAEKVSTGGRPPEPDNEKDYGERNETAEHRRWRMRGGLEPRPAVVADRKALAWAVQREQLRGPAA